MAYLHEVFKLSGVPTVTFVEPEKYYEIEVSMRTPGRCMVIEGPSGVGKSTTVNRALLNLNLQDNCLLLSPRQPGDIDIIAALPGMKDIGIVIIDDFHRLPDTLRSSLSDFMKTLADSSDENSKLVLIGINQAGQQLVKVAHDLGLRLDVFKLESNPTESVVQLLTLGEQALNVEFSDKQNIATKASGSFQIAQLLAHKLCTLSRIVMTQDKPTTISLTSDYVIEDVMVDLGRLFKEAVLTFARGSKLRREGRAPYLHILKWLSMSEDWSLDLREAQTKWPDHKASINQVLEKKYLAALLNDPEKSRILSPYFHFEQSTGVLGVEDPRLVFYLKNLVWRAFTREVGYKADYFQGKFDYALSFAGKQRPHAQRLKEILQEREVTVFYDHDEQDLIIARNVEDYLAPIYRSEAKYVVAFLSEDYPQRIWTKFESEQFKERFGSETLIPIRYTTSSPGWFSEEQLYGSLPLDPNTDTEPQLINIADILCRRLISDRASAQQAGDDLDAKD